MLCNVNNGVIIINPKLVYSDGAPVSAIDTTESLRDPEFDFMQSVVESTYTKTSEAVLQQRFNEYIRRFLDNTAYYEFLKYGYTNIGLTHYFENTDIFPYGPMFSSERHQLLSLKFMRNRIEGWRITEAYQYYEHV